jgi:hypothetical protein
MAEKHRLDRILSEAETEWLETLDALEQEQAAQA